MLTKKNYDVLIPRKENIENASASGKHYKNQGKIFDEFKNNLNSVFEYYESDEDFETLINLILIVFEKYLWCLPNIDEGRETDISLFNHLKDATAISHALYKSEYHKNKTTELNLIIGEMPGIQKYIFDITEKKPAKILRGRSIFVQLLNTPLCFNHFKGIGANRIKSYNVCRG